jgi:hypothetical protein
VQPSDGDLLYEGGSPSMLRLVRDNGGGVNAEAIYKIPAPTTTLEVLERWQREGALVHEATGLPRLDEATDGGPVYGTRWYLTGAPNAGKTALLLDIAHRWALRGIAVGMLAVDEEDSDLVTRLAQRAGYSRKTCEARDAGDMAAVANELGHLPIRFYGPGWTIERAATELAAFGVREGMSCALMIDSLQTVRCDLETVAEREMSQPAAIESRVHAIRAVASQHRLIVLCTSEMSRAGYAKRGTGENVDAMAASKWSGAIEYSARVLISLRSDVIELEIPKNKHGRERRASDDEALYLRLDRGRQTLEECDKPVPEDTRDEDYLDPIEEARIAKIESALLLALVRSRTDITSRADLAELVKGKRRQDVLRAIARLCARGQIAREGKGPFKAVRETEDSE